MKKAQYITYQLKDLRFNYSPKFTFNPKGNAFRRMPNYENFNRDNRYEMVLLINALQKLWDLPSVDDGEKMEYLIKVFLPENIHTQMEITDWLVLNWSTYTLPVLAKAI